MNFSQQNKRTSLLWRLSIVGLLYFSIGAKSVPPPDFWPLIESEKYRESFDVLVSIMDRQVLNEERFDGLPLINTVNNMRFAVKAAPELQDILKKKRDGYLAQAREAHFDQASRRRMECVFHINRLLKCEDESVDLFEALPAENPLRLPLATLIFDELFSNKQYEPIAQPEYAKRRIERFLANQKSLVVAGDEHSANYEKTLLPAVLSLVAKTVVACTLSGKEKEGRLLAEYARANLPTEKVDAALAAMPELAKADLKKQ